jgi:membrane protein
LRHEVRGARCEAKASRFASAWARLRWLGGWVWRLLNDSWRDNLSLVSAGVAFYAFFAIFPALVVLMSIYGLVTTPAGAEQQLRGIADLLPLEVYRFLRAGMRSVAGTSNAALGLGITGGLVLSLWSAAGGAKAMIAGLNIAYGQAERRSILRMNAVALLITTVGLVAGMLALLLVAVVPAVMSFFAIPARYGVAITLARWLVLTLMVALGVDLLYRFAPSARLHGVPKHFGLTPGGILAALVWLLASGLFSWYAGHFGHYNKTYGSVGVVVVLLLWLSLTVRAVLLGAELDAELAERRSSTRS